MTDRDNPPDLDALILDHGVAMANYTRHGTDENYARLEAARKALRARLAPTTDADDEALADDLIASVVAGAVEANTCHLPLDKWKPINDVAVRSDRAALLRRLAELRWQVDNWKGCKEQQQARAVKAERALAECRDRTIDECAALIDRWDAPENAANLIRKLKTKEPRDA